MDKNQRSSNSYFWVGLIVLFAFLMLMQYVRGTMAANAPAYTRGQYEQALDKGTVKSVVVIPNRETPTGSVRVTLSDDSVETFYATDVNELEDEARKAGLDPVVRDVPQENWFLSDVLPILLVTVICFFFFFLMSGQNGANSTNARMMNFGKSNAKRDDLKSKHTFADVAGLEEEKEQLE